MSPRGVPITDVRERLFAAAERVLAREGPGGLSNRSVTGEAGCAKGVLYSHFADLDEFVAELVLDRFRAVAQGAEGLPGRAGRGTVAGNLTGTALALLASSGPAVASLALTRAGVSARVRAAMAAGAPGMPEVERSLAAYLEAEQRLGRLRPAADCAALALLVVGTVHHLLMTAWAGTADPAERVRGFVAELVRGAGAAAA
ncbi:TetR/AcrR family transcriptional regulator [Kitasatospora herbaricolor]|uniref:TetR/AcrR family transcriptional regulator n=1 Tax=Kitasatospora herbaricolor TaxID=68217 RepID=A0ABZ1WC05_9ACTN|nr:TetR/AcrR family transcriptional regulator [Kitasatospora herbaricolor]